jgi:hypothetical protein
LSKKSRLLAIQFPDRPQRSLYAIEDDNTETLMAKLTMGPRLLAKMSGSSLQVNRRGHPVKKDCGRRPI